MSDGSMDTMPPAHDVPRQGSSAKNRGPLPSAEMGAGEPWQRVPRGRLPRATGASISRGCLPAARTARATHVFSDTRHCLRVDTQAQGQLLLLHLHTISRPPLVTACRSPWKRCMKPHLAVAGRANLRLPERPVAGRHLSWATGCCKDGGTETLCFS